MKKFFSPLVALLPLISSLSAQSSSTPDNPPLSTLPNSDTPPISNTPVTLPSQPTTYAIGSFAKPVFAAEYCTFLSDISGPQLEISLDAVQEKYLGTESPISCYGTPGDIEFGISREDQMHQIITSVPSYDAQYLFNLWRQNPTSIELASYLNDKYHLQWKTGSPAARPSYSAESGNIKSAYPHSTTLSLADTIAANPQIGMVFTFLNDRETTLITVSRNQFQSMDGWVAQLKKATDYYHRPSNIGHDGILMGN